MLVLCFLCTTLSSQPAFHHSIPNFRVFFSVSPTHVVTQLLIRLNYATAHIFFGLGSPTIKPSLLLQTIFSRKDLCQIKPRQLKRFKNFRVSIVFFSDFPTQAIFTINFSFFFQRFQPDNTHILKIRTLTLQLPRQSTIGFLPLLSAHVPR